MLFRNIVNTWSLRQQETRYDHVRAGEIRRQNRCYDLSLEVVEKEGEYDRLDTGLAEGLTSRFALNAEDEEDEREAMEEEQQAVDKALSSVTKALGDGIRELRRLTKRRRVLEDVLIRAYRHRQLDDEQKRRQRLFAQRREYKARLDDGDDPHEFTLMETRFCERRRAAEYTARLSLIPGAFPRE